MIVKRLRERRNWSQEQLAQISGLSLRTVQRVEAGNRASLETLKALSSVLETDISILTEEIMVIDKNSEQWRAEPLPIRVLLWGVNKRGREWLVIKILMVLVGIASWIVFEHRHVATPLAFICAYASAKLVAYVDKRGLW